jgi:hypothetical protein
VRALRIGFVAYWLAFVIFAVHQGQYPGYFGDPRLWSYPYGAVAAVCVKLALLLAVLYLILPATHFPYSRRRLGFAVVYVAVLLLFSVPPTDQPRYDHVLYKFAAVTFVGIVLLAVASVVHRLNRRGGSSP